ncbi:hypothetical protein ETD86_30115 [Nonomuraea turkmeniaca]|uniref:Uncharacterized protein n=1 Tax=Nonomuraea turkmeniaca TaxID=103838 RepID=A0A5S4F9U8_9ACTN|nr:hypothetical protein [Nonomuraea turkmeniaca]TMR13822.1 hypothetical protein ETD86_30115 [Nonomuraea turkmeniaca]
MHSTPDQRADPWDRKDELLAQLGEEIGVLAADHRRKKPRTFRRPDWVKKASRAGAGQSGMDRAFAVMAATAQTIT